MSHGVHINEVPLYYYAGFAKGDPHLVTLDGLWYTFNGHGEYILIEKNNGEFTMQGRMISARDANQTTVNATVLSALVAKDADSDTVQLEVDGSGTLIAIVSGERVLFGSAAELEFKNVTVRHLGDNSIDVLFSSGIYFVARTQNGFISFLEVILPESFMGQVQGLLGNYNGDDTDDLLPRFGDTPLPPDSDIEDIHNNFGITCVC